MLSGHRSLLVGLESSEINHSSICPISGNFNVNLIKSLFKALRFSKQTALRNMKELMTLNDLIIEIFINPTFIKRRKTALKAKDKILSLRIVADYTVPSVYEDFFF